MKLLNYLLTLILMASGVLAKAGELPAPKSVEDLLASYGWYVDQHNIAGVMALFAPEATLIAVGSDTSLSGTEAIAKLLVSAWERTGDDSQRRHLITGVRAFGETPDTVEFIASFGVVGTTPDGVAHAYNSGYYRGVARTTEQGLKFQSLIIAVD